MTGNGQSKPILECDELHGYLGEGSLRNHVLRGIHLELFPKELISVVGPSGCGKSSLLYLLGLLDRPESGSIEIHGSNYAQASDSERTKARNQHIGFIFQFHFLIPELTTLENVMLPLKKAGEKDQEAMEERAGSLLKEMGLGDKTRRLATQLSGGEQQRVAVARALANDPDVILADEPTGNLDVKNSEAVFSLLQKVTSEFNQAVLMVTHNLELANRADRIFEMRDGEFIHEPSD
jgi:lipoprotein-releasing system ATP-binding protein